MNDKPGYCDHDGTQVGMPCPFCGRLNMNPTSPTPKTHAEVAKKLWKRLIDADVDACNPDCDDQTRGPVAILATAIREEYERGLTIGFDRGQGWAKTREGAMERAGLVFDGEDKIVTRHGTILDDAGNVRKVNGTLPILASGEVCGFPPGVGSLWAKGKHVEVDRFDPLCMWYDPESRRIMLRINGLHGGMEFDGRPVGSLYSTRESALLAKDAQGAANGK